MEKVTDTIFNVGVNDYDIDLFEGQYELDEGMAYNSYVIMDDKLDVLFIHAHSKCRGGHYRPHLIVHEGILVGNFVVGIHLAVER